MELKKDDLISRTAAIEALSTPCDKRYRHGVWETCLDNIETAIRNIPAVDAAPVIHARWVHHEGGFNDHFECTACGEAIVLTGKWRFCPNCGARMDEDKNFDFADQSGAEYADNPAV